MAAPLKYPSWASTTVIDSLTGANNKVEPTEEFKLSGLLRGEFLSRSFFNYQMDSIDSWVQYVNKPNEEYTLTGETDIALTNGGKQPLVLTGNIVLTESLSDGEEVDLLVTSGGFTITYPVSVDFGDAGTPTLATKDIINLKKIGGVLYATRTWSKT